MADISLQQQFENIQWARFEDDQHKEYLREQRKQENIIKFTELSQIQGELEFDYLTEELSASDLFWLAIGSGDYSRVEEIKKDIIEQGVEKLYQQ